MKIRAIRTALLVVALVGCNSATELRSDERIPAATGTVEAKTGPNGNMVLKVMVKHLAPPSNLRPGATTYVVWAKLGAHDAPPQNLGALRVNDNLSGSLETVTPFSVFSIFISPEASPLVQLPTAEPLMMTLINRP